MVIRLMQRYSIQFRYHRLHPGFRPEPGTLWEQRLRRDRLPRHEVNRPALDKRGEDELCLHHGKAIADADMPAPTCT